VTGSFLALQDLPPLAGVKLVRPHRCAAGGAPAWPLAARRQDWGQLRGRIQKNSQPSLAAHVVTGPDPYALLTTVALMGADVSERVSGAIVRRGRPCREYDRAATIYQCWPVRGRV